MGSGTACFEGKNLSVVFILICGDSFLSRVFPRRSRKRILVDILCVAMDFFRYLDKRECNMAAANIPE